MAVSRVPLMRPQRLLIPLALLSPLALASPAMAADTSVGVIDFEFQPKSLNIDVGDTVTWNFIQAGHTATSDPGQPVSWNSSEQTNAAGTSYPKTFSQPGRYSYFCTPHAAFMKGVVTVGSDRYPKSASKFKLARKGKKITVSFTLRESARVVATLKGPVKKKATRKRLEPGRHSISFKKLKPGKYASSVTFTDDFDRLTKVKKSAVIR